MEQSETGPGEPKTPRKRTPRAKPEASNVAAPDVTRKVEEHTRPAETPEERDSRLRLAERAATFGHVRDSILLGLVCVIAGAMLIGSLSPWLDNDSRNKAFMILTTIASGAGTYLFVRPK